MNTDLSSNHQDEVYENNVLNLTANEIIVCNENNKSQGKKRKITTSTESTELIRNNKQQKLTVWDIFDWHTHYLALLQYDAEYGTCNVPQNFSYSCVLSQTLDMPGRPYHANLGKWLTKQRQSKKGNGPKLTQDRELLLQQLVDQGKLLWDASILKIRPPKEAPWSLHYAALLEYGRQNGHCNIPHDARFECDVLDSSSSSSSSSSSDSVVHYSGNLGKWLSIQRQVFKGEKSIQKQPCPERRALLQALVDQGLLYWDASCRRGLSGKSRKTTDLSWPRNYAALLQYKSEHGHCNVPHDTIYECEIINSDGIKEQVTCKLGNFVHDVRQAHRGTGHNAKLTSEREQLLQVLVDEGKFLWNPSATSLRHSWDIHYAALLEYGRQHGHYNVPHMLTYECTFMRTADDGAIISTPYKGNLGYWLSSQRQYKKNNSETLESNTDVNKSNCQSTTVSKHRLALLQALVNEGKLLWDETAYLTSNGHNNDEYMEPA